MPLTTLIGLPLIIGVFVIFMAVLAGGSIYVALGERAERKAQRPSGATGASRPERAQRAYADAELV